MKVFIKRSIIFIGIIYMLLSLLLNIYCSISYKNMVKNFKIPNSNELKEEVVEISNDTSVGDLIQISYYSGKLEVVYYQLRAITISIILGVFISLCTLLKENSKIKFVLFFIVGNIIFNLLCTFILLIAFKKNGIDVNFVEKYIEMTEHTFIIYSLVYLMVLMIALLDMKIKIKKINETIKKND